MHDGFEIRSPIDSDSPDKGFAPGRDSSSLAVEAGELAEGVCRQIISELTELISTSRQRLDAAFALTMTAQAVHILVSDDDQVLQVRPSEPLLALLRQHRHLSAQLGDGPWWRLVISIPADGEAEIEFDYGAEPFPDDQLFPASVYRADLQAYPRRRLPVWLAAYLTHGGRQSRTPRLAAVQAQADRSRGNSGTPCGEGIPPLAMIWARWAVISAAFVAVDSPWGPRMSPALGWFEGSSRSGSTLHRLPGGLAVLSGGIWNATELDAAYNDGAALPGIYLGAPAWIADPVVNPRAANGLLSFCYWWDGTQWCRGESPAPEKLSAALPAVWTRDTTIEIISRLIDQPNRPAITDLVAAAEACTITLSLMARAFNAESAEIENAYYQLLLAGTAESSPPVHPGGRA